MNIPSNELTEDKITFGQYKDLTLTEILRDRKYCKWLLTQDWFSKQYPYLYNRVTNHSPKQFFIKPKSTPEIKNVETKVNTTFLNSYEYFNLTPIDKLEINLSEREKTCYSFYLQLLDSIKLKIVNNKNENPYNISAPTGWLKKFEKDTGFSRDILKEFLSAYELKNIPYVIEDVKKMGGIDYKGARSFLIAKENSKKQEKWWEQKLREKFDEDISTQFSFNGSIFDAICIKTKTLYEMKLNIKDFNQDQHRKYLATLGSSYKFVYLIGLDCIINLEHKKIYTTDQEKYLEYICLISTLKKPSNFDKLIETFPVIEINDILNHL